MDENVPMELHVLERQVLASVTTLSLMAQQVLVTIVRLLAEGESVALPRVATSLDLPVGQVEAVVGRLRTASRDAEGRVTACFGLTVEETPHRVVIDDRELHTWCAWDALLLPALLADRVRCSSPCPVTGETLEVEVEPTGEIAARPPSTVMTFALFEGPPGERLRESFCELVRFVSDSDAAERWTSALDNTIVLRLEEAARLARAVDEACCPDVLGVRHSVR